MIIEVGKRYWTRDGRVAFIIEQEENSIWPFIGKITGCSISRTWTKNGFSIDAMRSKDTDLVAEYHEQQDSSSGAAFEHVRKWEADTDELPITLYLPKGRNKTQPSTPVVGDRIDFYISCNADRQLLTGKVEHKDQLGLVCIVEGVRYEVKNLVDITIKKR